MTATIDLAEDVRSALCDNAAAGAAWDRLAPSCRREYLEWIEEAKKPETRARRIAKTLEMLVG
jgi:uncharacterized protein YdeI (YjbR/CyaY-like superfamily)